MSDPSLERLSRFTPDSGRLDRDALLFAAGRSSARPNRGWKTLASILAGTQVLSLILLWPHSTPQAAGFGAPVAAVSEPPVTLELPTAHAWANAGLWSARHRPLASETEDRPTGKATLIDSGPPFRASGPLPASLLN
jgi:hypothetical protein